MGSRLRPCGGMPSRRSPRFHRRWPPSTRTSEDGFMVRIVLASPIATATGGEREFEVDFQGTLRDLFDVVTTKYGRQFQQRIWSTTSKRSRRDRKSTRLNSSHSQISYAVFCLKKKNIQNDRLSVV